MHGTDKEEVKKIINHKLIKRVDELYGKKEEVKQDYGYLFKEGVESLRTRSTQYLIKWVASFRMAENIIARGKLKNKKGVPIRPRRGGKRKG